MYVCKRLVTADKVKDGGYVRRGPLSSTVNEAKEVVRDRNVWLGIPREP